jgi:hypothetical protein
MLQLNTLNTKIGTRPITHLCNTTGVVFQMQFGGTVRLAFQLPLPSFFDRHGKVGHRRTRAPKTNSVLVSSFVLEWSPRYIRCEQLLLSREGSKQV